MSMPAKTPFYGWYGDDFTGATDTLATLSLRGVKAFLFLGPPSERQLAQAGELDAIGIAGSARTMSPAAMEAELEPVGRFFAEAGIRLLHYKCCSTFDSAPEIGNIAVAVRVLRRFVSREQAFILGGQPSLGRYCAFGNLFAAGGASGVHRLDRHPTMSRHPSTPMTEADLRRHLQALGAGEIALVPWTALDAGDTTLEAQADILFDALTQDHIATIGKALNRFAEEGSFIIAGASSVAEAVYQDRAASPPAFSATDSGPVLAVAGSLSPLTHLQVEAATAYIRIEADAERFVSEESYRERLAAKICLSLCEERNVLLSTAPQNPASISGANAELAEATGRFVDRLLDQVPVRRLIAAGGDTSSHLAQNLGLWGLAYGGQLSPGVAISTGRSDNPARDGMTLMLKGGQMGSVDLFDRFAVIPSQTVIPNDQLAINTR
ncbi:four-carbon acid sugar kinase family protein [Rhizobium sp. XQZ8]|uniref:four-carbon acid sugar kinase family protein n=1 Tax=Rhizobium populisoli TaxID=2859785 RepID=UPI001CA4A341|nr:four-carbon acid sugar kinase family protein [Rhizobium populisoli]MBW6422044.1 four-carbon acid sugar kinase family protein [Rhizobium populisoli]